jgi:hypothetical protein
VAEQKLELDLLTYPTGLEAQTSGMPSCTGLAGLLLSQGSKDENMNVDMRSKLLIRKDKFTFLKAESYEKQFLVGI